MIGTWVGIIPSHLPEPYARGYLLFWTLYALSAWASMIAVLGCGRRWLVQDNRALDYTRPRGYGWYLVHQPVIVALAYLIVRWPISTPMKLVVLAVTSLAATLLGTEILRRAAVTRRLFALSS